MMRSRPLRSVTSIVAPLAPSEVEGSDPGEVEGLGRNATLHGCESPVATADTRTWSSEVKSVTGRGGIGGDAARADFWASAVEPIETRATRRPSANRLSIPRIVA